MITFNDPLYLQLGWLMLIYIGLFILYRLWQSKAQRALGEGAMVQPLLLGKSKGRLSLKFILQLLALACLVLAVADPVSKTNYIKSEPKGQAAIVFAVDVSNSMLAEDVLPNRLTQAKRFIADVTTELKGDEVGVVVFAGKAYPYMPLTTDYKTVRSAGKQISTDMVARQGTSLQEALKMSALLLHSRQDKARIICVISDGETHTEAHGYLADSLSKAGIYIYSYGVGTPAGDFIPETKAAGVQLYKKDKNGAPIVSRLQEESLSRLVASHPDRYTRFSAGQNSVTPFVKAIRALPASKTGQEKAVDQELFQYFLLAALLILVVELLIAPGKLRSSQTHKGV